MPEPTHPTMRELLSLSEETHDRTHPKLPDIKELNIADRRIKLGPGVGRLTVDYRVQKLHMAEFEFIYRLAQTPDEAVTYRELINDLYGLRNLSASSIRSFVPNFHARVHVIRNALGAELGDAECGAIRPINARGENRQEGGYLAVGEL